MTSWPTDSSAGTKEIQIFQDRFIIFRNRIISDNESEILVTMAYWKGDPRITEYEAIFEQILSSFRFVDVDE